MSPFKLDKNLLVKKTYSVSGFCVATIIFTIFSYVHCQGHEVYLNGSSVLLIPTSISLLKRTTFSIKTCMAGELLYQEKTDGDFLKIFIATDGNLNLEFFSDHQKDIIPYSYNLLDNRWHNIDLNYNLNQLNLQIDKHPVLVVANSTYKSHLIINENTFKSDNAHLGRNFTGCILEGISIPLSDQRVISSSKTWNSCPLPNTGSCDGYLTDHCFHKPCQSVGKCVSLENGYRCDCPIRYSGEHCEIDKGPLCLRADLNLCQNGGTCLEDFTKNNTYCLCLPQFVGPQCQTFSLTNICRERPCRNGGVCVSSSTVDYTCFCPAGFVGEQCQFNVDECQEQPCLNNGSCTDETNLYSCDCKGTGYRGIHCEINIDECAELSPCSFGSICFDNYGGYICDCPFGKGGSNCHISLDGCTTQPCLNGGTCITRDNHYECRCPLGFEGQHCEINPDDCTVIMCPQNSHCVDGVNRYTCVCDQGFAGNPPNCFRRVEYLQSSICEEGMCQNGGTCHNVSHCLCPEGFEGQYCQNNCTALCLSSNHEKCNCTAVPVVFKELSVSPCSSDPCLNGGYCQESENDFVCECLSGWRGLHCELSSHDPCNSQPCLHGSCINSAGSYSCNCLAGYSGINCETDIDDCFNIVCAVNHQCFDLVNNFECRCPDGYTGEDCSIKLGACSNNLCKNGTCVESNTEYTCACSAGFTGLYCDVDIDECISAPCINGLCKNTIGSFLCYCEPGYTGHKCHVEFDECLSNPCQFGGTCRNLISDYHCDCAPGFQGRNCEFNIDECVSSPCRNGGTCQDSINSYQCHCLPGFTGSDCEVDIDECASQPCLHNGTCLDGINHFNCSCFDVGFEGAFCELNIDDCKINPCENGATCQDLIKDYHCLCYKGYTGKNCHIDIPECNTHPCENNSPCFEKSNRSLYETNYLGMFTHFSYENASGYVCKCPIGFTGENCQINIDDCEYHDCLNGSCIDEINSYSCQCHLGFEGDKCNVEINECETLKPCQNGAVCHDLVANYSCDCQESYGGRNCQVELLGCKSGPCKNEAKCIPFLNGMNHEYTCFCLPGYLGLQCQIQNIVSFNNATTLTIRHLQLEEYSVSLQFRTTLESGILFHTSGRNSFYLVLYLYKGLANLALENSGNHQLISEPVRTALNDGTWKYIGVQIDPFGRVLFNVSNWIKEERIYVNLMDVTNTVFGGGGLPPTFAELNNPLPNFVGCMREIRIANHTIIPEEEQGENIALGCLREKQCLEDTCSKIGFCKDLWFSHHCSCPRPYYGGACQNTIPAATFGYQNSQSWMEVDITQREEEKLTPVTEISLFVRTRDENGFLFYLGPTLKEADVGYTANNPEHQGAFLAALIEEGLLKVISGNAEMNKVIIKDEKLNNGFYHFIKVLKNDSSLIVSVNASSTEPTFFGSEISPDVFYLGGLPFQNAKSRMRRQSPINVNMISTHSWEKVIHFKGIIQDIRINNKTVRMGEETDLSYSNDIVGAPPLLEADITVHNISIGVLSDDPCLSEKPCMNGGTCRDIWNNYVCDCISGYRGLNCSEFEPCYLYKCPESSLCINLPQGYDCVTEASFRGVSVLEYHPRLTSLKTSANSVSFRFRSQQTHGTILYISTSQPGHNHHLSITIGESLIVQWNLANGDTIGNLNVGSNVTDGEWHSAHITINNTIVKAVLDQVERYAEYPTTIMLSNIYREGNIFVGGNGQERDEDYFIGCLDNIRIGDLLLPFFTSDRLANNTATDRFELKGSLNPHVGCVVCWSEDCLHNGTCENPTTQFQCSCPSTYVGRRCEEDLDECLEHPCFNGASCNNLHGSFECICPPHFKGTICDHPIDYCEDQPCQNYGVCVREETNYTCECRDQFKGRNCQELIMENCSHRPCLNDATCNDVTPVEGVGFSCNCLEGYTGQRCENKINYCTDQSCSNRGRCESQPFHHSIKFVCHCNPGYSGEICTEVEDPCSFKKCPSDKFNCISGEEMSITCLCKDGFRGEECDLDIDECDEEPCENDGNCTNLVGSYFCACNQDWVGQNCSIRDPCISYICGKGGVCYLKDILQPVPLCNCSEGFEGVLCQIEIADSGPDNLALAIGLTLGCICVICGLVALFVFLRIAKKKRATRGTYSPSRQEMFGSRVEMNHVIKPPPEERLI